MLETVIRWGAYLGGWLLVIGPLFQSRVELEAERAHLTEVRETIESTAPPSRVSAWWWLIPPVALFLSRRRQSQYVDTLTTVLTTAQMESLERYFSVARGWMIVAAGAVLIAVKETFELAHHQHWLPGGFWVLAVIGLIATVAFTSAGPARSDRHRLRRTPTVVR
ncbi:Integral membrane protein OS=Tsukamurella paurometabola (strain ATCC 8368 / DSM / CCUG 35730/ CIP 100753 / JCM 10117 / KCTC 9821 / NBRC 16120 / NCIMB 702349/ NCTC 13040) OX=521096 GN=Tpau_1961 PE=4 SV=1 [Tsukamurella paurometabola]|uniref:Uncharacterized protein n=1 Tax=Tsukamurella paurometabola (strain ATCC 8368 / DSM 20162 / CCUG 35730 / CIP 100753 / JCM 10117 / KCTC 9821 / NBRC 16120 / NCIMB 702349 / NCTC 13040) TaxID=521096 RepID=D5UNK5_TSUPD|nr:hypothetical protein [Tsukamurella paurometabola]ADG78573.1 hypothetical protein Tpau_1961 [Tsukamurella paurometabola DSM 20162]SUP32244.1 Uncharacterised protein [Tsukamurella paurometabola]